MNTHLKHPTVESAMTLDDIAPGVNYVTYIPGDRVIERGTFTSEPTYDVIERGTFTSEPTYDGETDKRWSAEAKIAAGKITITKTVLLFESGITPDETGERWSDKVTVVDEGDS